MHNLNPADIESLEIIEPGPVMSGWDDVSPAENRAGHFYDADGNKHYIDLNDPHALLLANELKVDGIFQFDSSLAKSTLANGVRNFEDLMLLNAMGHPGPMECVRHDSKINTKLGKVAIKDLSCTDEICYMSETGLKTTSNYQVFGPEVKDILEITLADGTVHNVGLNHRFATKRGYVLASELTEEDEVLRF